MRITGTLSLIAGFVCLAVSRLIEDPTAPDANIGAGILTIAGLALGGIGLVLLAAGYVVTVMSARHQRRTS